MRFGIPEFKMEKAVLDRRIRQMRDEGTNFRCGVEVGKSVTGQQLKERYDAVVLAVGSTIAAGPARARARAGRHPPGDGVPAAGQPGRSRRTVDDQITAKGKHVVIIGGGDTGADCLGTAIRQGAKSITQLEILPTPPEERPDAPAVAHVPDDLPGVLGARRGRRPGLLGVDVGVPGRRERQRGASLALSEVSSRAAS